MIPDVLSLICDNIHVTFNRHERKTLMSSNIQVSRSKIDLPVPSTDELYCVREVLNFASGGYAYLRVNDSRSERTLFYYYAMLSDNGSYGSFMDDLAALVPLHFTRIRDGLVTFERDKTCVCGEHKRSLRLPSGSKKATSPSLKKPVSFATIDYQTPTWESLPIESRDVGN